MEVKNVFSPIQKVYAILHTPFQEDVTPKAATELSQNILVLYSTSQTILQGFTKI